MKIFKLEFRLVNFKTIRNFLYPKNEIYFMKILKTRKLSILIYFLNTFVHSLKGKRSPFGLLNKKNPSENLKGHDPILGSAPPANTDNHGAVVSRRTEDIPKPGHPSQQIQKTVKLPDVDGATNKQVFRRESPADIPLPGEIPQIEKIKNPEGDYSSRNTPSKEDFKPGGIKNEIQLRDIEEENKHANVKDMSVPINYMNPYNPAHQKNHSVERTPPRNKLYPEDDADVIPPSPVIEPTPEKIPNYENDPYNSP